MKKNCNSCRAREITIRSGCYIYKCALGYSMYDNIPKENCPKPKTYEEYLDFLRRRKNDK